MIQLVLVVIFNMVDEEAPCECYLSSGSSDIFSTFLWTLLSQEADHMDCIRDLLCPLAEDLVPIIGRPSRSSRGHCFSQDILATHFSCPIGATTASTPYPSKAHLLTRPGIYICLLFYLLPAHTFIRPFLNFSHLSMPCVSCQYSGWKTPR